MRENLRYIILFETKILHSNWFLSTTERLIFTIIFPRIKKKKNERKTKEIRVETLRKLSAKPAYVFGVSASFRYS